MSFEEIARLVYDEQKEGWHNTKHSSQWINSLEQYVFPRLGAKKVDELTAADFAEVLRPIWLVKQETASRVKQRCDKVMVACVARGLIPANPVTSVDHLLSKQLGKRERTVHQPAMPWRQITSFVRDLRSGPYSVTRVLLEFVVLTAARSGEARAMTWAEVDFDARIWTVPANRMKAKVAHRVPLSDRALEILLRQKEMQTGGDLVFPSPRGVTLSDMVLTKFLRDQNVPSSEEGRTATAHGFRSSFRDWASENGYPRDVAERALAHTIKNSAEAAYHRTDLLDQRRAMMEHWGRYAAGRTEMAQVEPGGQPPLSDLSDRPAIGD